MSTPAYDFDAVATPSQIADRSARLVRIGGQTIAHVEKIPADVMLALGGVNAASSETDDMRVLRDLTFALIEPEDHDQLRDALAARGPDMIDLTKLQNLIAYIVARATGRPFEAPSASPPPSMATPRPGTL